jgi:leader peptidase (prepilin peptidase)/N-methyltransferase
MFFLPFIFFLFGLIIGSFLNVVIYRYNTGRTVGGRSMCFCCGTPLGWYELIPVASFVIQKGKCRTCGSRISSQYIAVELATAILFACVPVIAGFDLTLFTQGVLPSVSQWVVALYYMVVVFILLFIFAYDLRHKIIPDGAVFSLIGLSFIAQFFIHGGQFFFALPSLLNFLAGPLVALPFYLIWLLSRGEYIGFGDIKLFVAVGWLFGLYNAFSAVTLSFWIGALVSLVLLYVPAVARMCGLKKVTRKTEIPFGPFIILGIFLVLIFHIDVFYCIGILTGSL